MVGYPQVSAIIECSFGAHGRPGGQICSDGGCVYAGDVVKSFAVGSDFCMVGSMVSGTDECEGEWEYDNNGNKIKFRFYGMSSKFAQDKHNNGLAGYRASEGRCVFVDYKGTAKDIILDICGGIRSACAYVGAKKLKHLHKCAEICRVTDTHNRIFEKNN